nr:hypothetical protein GCM10020092_076180 [Actinoplanes digitatis]
MYALVPAIGYPALIFVGFLAGSALLLIPGRWAWASFAVVLAGFSAILVHENPSVAYLTYSAAIMAAIGLMVYGLSRLADLAVQLEALRGETARMAVHRERLRTARDVHDLLGQGLSVLTLKIVLIDRLIDHDEARARAEIEEAIRICTTARDETRLVTDGIQHLSLRAEIAVARSVLTSAGIDVRADLADGPLLGRARRRAGHGAAGGRHQRPAAQQRPPLRHRDGPHRPGHAAPERQQRRRVRPAEPRGSGLATA